MQFLPGAEAVDVIVSDEICFVDQGEYFQKVSCPRCKAELSIDWWKAEMNRSFESKFEQMNVVTPCCALETSLNDLDYQFPAGFSRCRLEARHPKQREVPLEQLRELEQTLETPLRQIFCHY